MTKSHDNSGSSEVASNLELLVTPKNSVPAKTNQQRTCLLVLGMHRSGTSALTRVLNLTGASLPSNLLGPNEANVTGHWESATFYHYNDELLEELGSSWSDWSKLDWNGITVERRNQIKKEILEIIESEFSDSPQFVIKDPRICRFAGLFIEILEEARINVRIVLVIRNPLEVCESLSRRDSLLKPESALLWLRHTLEAEFATRKYTRAIVTYDDLLSDWKETVNKISKQLSLNYLNKISEIDRQIEEFLSPAHRHHFCTTEELQSAPVMQNWVADSYKALLKLCNNQDLDRAFVRLDKQLSEFNRATPLFSEFGHSLSAKYEDEISSLKKQRTQSLQSLEHGNQLFGGNEIEQDRKLIEESKLFDANWYIANNPDVQVAGMNPLEHFLEYGWVEGRNPSKQFDIQKYVEKNPKVATTSINPLIHYINSRQKNDHLEENHYDSTEIEQLNNSILFNSDWYLATYSKTDFGDLTPAEHFLKNGSKLGYDPGPVFETSEYLAANPDVASAGINPLLHYLKHGAREGRPGWSVKRSSKWQAPFITDTTAAIDVLDHADKNNPLPKLKAGDKIGVFCHSEGNLFFLQIQDLLCQAFENSGVRAEALTEKSIPTQDLSAKLVIAPHEFFYVGQSEQINYEQNFQNAIILNTEQLHTSWFARSFPYILQAKWVLDMNLQSAASLNQLGITTRFLPLGFVQNYTALQFHEGLPDEPATQAAKAPRINKFLPQNNSLIERPLDILFVGAQSDRRTSFFSKNANFFADKQSFLHLADLSSPLRKGASEGLSTEAFSGLAQRSKILLNIHQSEVPYFEWQRIVFFGFWQNTCVVTDIGSRIPGFIPGVHYFEDRLENLPDLMEWLLKNKQGQKAADNARNLAKSVLLEQYQLDKTIQNLFHIKN